MRELRLLDAAGQYVRKLSEEEAETLCATGKAEYRKGRRPVVVLLSKLTVEDFDRGASDGATGLRTTYRETHAGKSIIQLKRRTKDGTLAKWDNDLTFAELRSGQYVSRTTRERRERIERERLRKLQEQAA